MRDIDLRQLEVFQATMECRSVSRAAKVLGISQPAVSTRLQRLETQLGFPLFSRERRRLEPMPEAVLLMEEVTHALRSLEKIRDAVHDIKNAGSGMLTISANPTCSISWLPEFVANFRATRPAVRVRLITRSSDIMRENPATYAADVMISEPPIDPSSVETRRYRLRCVAALPVDHPLCEEAVITPENASPFPFIALSRWQATHYRVSRAFDDNRQNWNVAVECELFSTALMLVSEGAGISISEPVIASEFERQGKVVLRRFEPEIGYEVAFYHPADRPLTVLGRKFVDEFSDHMAQYIEP